MANFYFFTEPNNLLAQTANSANKAFGPIVAGDPLFAGGKDRFRITDLHAADSPHKAYAICNGVICVQQAVNDAGIQISGIVNLILKPSKQPENDLPYVSYYIYKGIKADSLLTGNNLKNVGNDLVQSIWKSAPANTAQPTKEVLGIQMVDAFKVNNVALFKNDDPIDNLFYKGDPNFSLHTVYGGWSLGDFDPTKFGLEIIVERIGYRPAIRLARRLENYVEVLAYTGPSTPANNAPYFDHWHKKEEILNFLDPCSFWGSFGNKELKALDNTGKFKSLEYAQVYNTVLKGSAGNFLNRKAIWLDLRNEHGGSLNYYKNYGNVIKISTDGGINFAEQNYYKSGWPWYLYTAPTTVTAGQTSVLLDVALPKTDNTLPLVYLSQVPGVEPMNDPARFLKVRRQSFSDYITPMRIEIPLITDGAPCFRAAIARFMYCRRIDKTVYVNPPVSAATTLPYLEHLDYVFQPYAMSLPFERVNKLGIKVYKQEVFIDKTHVDGTMYIGHAGICEDQDNYTFFVFPVRGSANSDLQSVKGYPKNTSIDAFQSTQSFLDYLMKQYGYFFIRHENTVDGQAVSTYSALNSSGTLEKPSVLIVNKAKMIAAKQPSQSTMNFTYCVFLSMLKDTNAVVGLMDNIGVFEQQLLGFKGTSLVETVNFLMLEKNFGYGNIQ